MSYKLTVSTFFSFILTSTSALAITCANDYGGSSGCASNAAAAGDCETLGYATEDVNGCKHYLYCPFDTAYKKCVAQNQKSCVELGFTKDDKSEWCGEIITCESDPSYTSCVRKIATCPTGELNPSCDAGYAPKQIDITEDYEACYECVPATCETASSGEYFSPSNYFPTSSSYLPRIKNFDIFNSSTNEMVNTACFQKCTPELQLKTITQANCPVGSWLIRYNSKYYCTNSAISKSAFSTCSGFEVQGVVAYHSGSDIYAIYSLGNIVFSYDDWGSASYPSMCPSYYQQSRKDRDPYYNYQVLMNMVGTTQYSKFNCVLSPYSGGGSLLLRLYNLNAYGLKYGIPDETALSEVFKKYTTISQAVTNSQNLISMQEKDTWVDRNGSFGLFTSVSSNLKQPYVWTYYSVTGYTSKSAKEPAQGILIGKINGL